MADPLYTVWKAFLEFVKVNWKIFAIANKKRNPSCINTVKIII